MPFVPQDKAALQGNDVTVFAKNRCSRSAGSEQRRGLPRVRLKKTGSLAAPRFFFFRMPPFMSKTSTTARTAKAVCKRLSKF
jgi:hypothetical protein